jgi:hypothetical protein
MFYIFKITNSLAAMYGAKDKNQIKAEKYFKEQ